jgi:hypothetical protein
MKTSESGDGNEALRTVLKEWRADVSLPPHFQEGVWQRIERAKATQTATQSMRRVVAHWIGTVLPRPALAVAYVAILVAIGLTAGWVEGRRKDARVKDNLSQRYVRLLDPYRTPRE